MNLKFIGAIVIACLIALFTGLYFGGVFNKNTSSKISQECKTDCTKCSSLEMCKSNINCKTKNDISCVSKDTKIDCTEDCGSNEKCNTNNGKCECNDGFSGEDCNTVIITDDCNKDCSKCSSKQMCAENNKCKFIKSCIANDQSVMCKPDCGTNGKCDQSTGECKCSPGFEGDDCSKTTCPKNCSGQGSCNKITKKCTCKTGFTGDDCSKLEGYVFDSTSSQCSLKACSDNIPCWKDQESCNKNNPTQSSYIYYNQKIPVPDSSSNWGKEINGLCQQVNKSDCTKGLNVGGVNASGKKVTSDKSANLCYENNDSGVLKCLSDFYNNINQNKTNSNKPDYWIETINGNPDCFPLEKNGKFCCPGFDSTACGTEPGQTNHEYNDTKNLIFNNSCFIGENNCKLKTHNIGDQLLKPVMSAPSCPNYEYANGKCPVLEGVTNEANCKKEADKLFWSYDQGGKGDGKYCECYQVTDDKYANGASRVTKFVNGKCYVTEPTPKNKCWKVRTSDIKSNKRAGDCFADLDACKKHAAKVAGMWYFTPEKCFANNGQ